MPYPNGLPISTIWDEIAFHIISTRDLLSLALTCRDFKELVIPDHLDFRHIACDIRRIDAWECLGSRPRLTRGIRSISLYVLPGMGSHDGCVPRALNMPNTYSKVLVLGDITKKDVVMLRNAISHMLFLKEITWTHNDPSDSHALAKISNIFTSSAPLLEGLCANIYTPPLSMRDEDNKELVERLSIWTLTGLKRVSVSGQIQAAIRMALSCLAIEDLYLGHLSSNSASYLLQRANWKKLRRLSLSFLYSSTAGDLSPIMTTFLQCHANIESLYLDLNNVITVKLSSPCLPKLRSLVIFRPADEFSLTSFLSLEGISRMVHLDCPVTNVSIGAFQQMDSLRTLCLSRFEHLSLENIASFLPTRAPNLEKIFLAAMPLAPSSWGNIDMQANVIRILLQYSKLTHVFTDFEFSGTDDADFHRWLGDLCRSLSPLLALKYLQIVRVREERYAKLERDKNGDYCGHLLVTMKEAGGYQGYWGDAFLGF